MPIEEIIEFAAGQSKSPVSISIVDDKIKPVLEGIETFYLVLQYPAKATISEPETMKISINDKELDSMLTFSLFSHIADSNTLEFFQCLKSNHLQVYTDDILGYANFLCLFYDLLIIKLP